MIIPAGDSACFSFLVNDTCLVKATSRKLFPPVPSDKVTGNPMQPLPLSRQGIWDHPELLQVFSESGHRRRGERPKMTKETGMLIESDAWWSDKMDAHVVDRIGVWVVE